MGAYSDLEAVPESDLIPVVKKEKYSTLPEVASPPVWRKAGLNRRSCVAAVAVVVIVRGALVGGLVGRASAQVDEIQVSNIHEQLTTGGLTYFAVHNLRI